MPPFCPYCKKELDYLILKEDVVYVEHYKFWVDENGKERYDPIKEIPIDTDGTEFYCPHCKRVITRDHYEAALFISGDVEIQIKLVGMAEKRDKD